MPVTCVISGGQTGADRGGLDAAIELGVPHGGYCPRGRRAEDGRIPGCYRLVELDADDYPARTRKNVVAADGTVIFTRGMPGSDSGSLLTLRLCVEIKMPYLHLDLARYPSKPDIAVDKLAAWLRRHKIQTLNVAGSRESTAPGIRGDVQLIVAEALTRGMRT